MVSLRTAKLAGLIMTTSLVVIAGTNSAFAAQPCGEQPYVYNVGCVSLGTAQMYAVALVVGVIALAVGLGVAGRKHVIHQI